MSAMRRLPMRDANSKASEPETPAHYLFIVARDRADILARVRERLRDDLRIEVIVDRRRGERRKSGAPHAPERRRADRRRPTRHWDDLSVYPTLVVQRRVESYAELQQKLIAGGRESQVLREENERLGADNARLREAVASLERRVEALVAADVSLKAEVSAMLAQAEETVGALIAQFRARLGSTPRSVSSPPGPSSSPS